MMKIQKMDPNKLSHKLVISGLIGMVEDDGLTPHEVLEVVEDIKRQTFHALTAIYSERRTAK